MKTQPKKMINELISTFKCEKTPELEHFLKNTARHHDSKDISKTYLLIEGNKTVIGFFTLAMKCMTIDGSLKGAEIYEHMNVNKDIAQAYLIGQLARSDGSEKGIGHFMINSILGKFIRIKDDIGCRIVRLDCNDELVQYYSEMGFERVKYNSDNNLNQMIMII